VQMAQGLREGEADLQHARRREPAPFQIGAEGVGDVGIGVME
jgi:hypothetical protein